MSKLKVSSILTFSSENRTSPLKGWRSIDDVVMGGVSQSQFIYTDDYAVFQGHLSLENNGGFASVRSPKMRLPLADQEGLVLRVRGDGLHYQCRLRASDQRGTVSYMAPFAPTARAEGWEDIYIPFSEFRPRMRGHDMPKAGPLTPAAMQHIGLLISGKQEGPFRLAINEIMSYCDGIGTRSG